MLGQTVNRAIVFQSLRRARTRGTPTGGHGHSRQYDLMCIYYYVNRCCVCMIVSELAQILHDKPCWSFELLLVGDPERLDSPEGARSFAVEEVRQRLTEAEKALGHGLGEAAFLLVWSAFEAVVRELIAAEGVSITRVTQSGYVFDQAVYHGVISRVDYDYLADMRRYRNAIAHGFDVNGFSDEKVTALIGVIARLLDSEPELV